MMQRHTFYGFIKVHIAVLTSLQIDPLEKRVLEVVFIEFSMPFTFMHMPMVSESGV